MMISLKHTGIWFGYAALMTVTGWVLAATLSTPTDSRSISNDNEPNLGTRPDHTPSPSALPSLHARIKEHFRDLQNTEKELSLEDKLSKLSKIRSHQMQELGYVLLAAHLPVSEINQAVERLVDNIQESGPEAYQTTSVLKTMIEQVSALDPERAWTILDNLPRDLFEGDVFCEELILARLREDPDSVFQYVKSHFSTNNYQREELWGLIAKDLASIDLKRAREALAEMPGDNGQAVTAIALEWAKTDPEAAVRWGSSFGSIHPDPAISVLIDWMNREPHAALDLEEKYSIAVMSGEMSPRESMVRYWSSIDAEAALAWGLSATGSNYLFEAVDGIESPKEALEIARKHSEGAELKIAPHLAQRYAYDNPSEAVNWLKSLPDHPDANLACMLALNGMGMADPGTQAFAKEHFAELWHPEFDITDIGQGYHYGQKGVAGGIVRLIADDPHDFIDEIRQQDTARLDSLILYLSNYNISATTEYILKHPNDLSGWTIKSIIEKWKDRDYVAATKFIQQHGEFLEQKTESN